MRQPMPVCLCFALMLVLAAQYAVPALSQETALFQRIEIPSSFNPVGSGARALGMGGAFIAVADDATAASWNPGGLLQVAKPEISIVGDFFHRIEDINFGTHPESNGSQSVDKWDINYLSATYPFVLWQRNMVASVNYQQLYDFTRQWNFPLRIADETGYIDQNVENRQDGDLSALGLAYAIQLTRKVYFGLTFNIWNDDITDNEWENKTFQWGNGDDRGDRFELYGETVETFSFEGWNMNFGVLWNPTAKLTVGAVLKTPFDADLTRKFSSRQVIGFDNPAFADQDSSSSFEEEETLSIPISYGIGLAYRFSDAFSMSLDIYRTEWDDFELEDSSGNKTSPISGKPTGESAVDATTQVRMGAEYLFIKPTYVVPVRCGLFYDPAPTEGGTDAFYGFSLGTGVGCKRYIWDIAYQFRYGSDVSEFLFDPIDFSQDVAEHTVYTSLIVHF